LSQDKKEKNKLTLSKPIKAHGEDVTSLTFRPPTGEDLIEIGGAAILDR
jgi:hypothetical protein